MSCVRNKILNNKTHMSCVRNKMLNDKNIMSHLKQKFKCQNKDVVH